MLSKLKILFRLLLGAAVIIPCMAAVSACGNGNQSRAQLRIYNADSLIIPFLEIEKIYEQTHPDLDVII